MNTTSDLLEKVSASYIPIERQQDLSLTDQIFFSAKDGNYLINQSGISLLTLVCFESFAFTLKV